ncbi:MAG: 6-phosphogluconolactonase [Ignavibacteria bacterium]|nr:6-phosphogluconolactonase [Ignavibacteria bacterium]
MNSEISKSDKIRFLSDNLKSYLSLFLFLSIIYFMSISLQSCEQDFVNSSGNNSGFPDEIQAIFNEPYSTSNITCTTPSCHASENPAENLDLTSWQNTLNGSENGTMVIPYNGFWSHMISVLNSDTLIAPVTTVSLTEYHKIGSDKVGTIMNWINSGAASKEGQIAFSDYSNNLKCLITNQAADVVAVLKTDNMQVTRLVPVGGRSNQLDAPHYVNLSPDSRYFYVSLIQEGYVEKYDVSNYAEVGRMQAGSSPAHIEITPDGNYGFVTNFESTGSVTTTTKFNATNMTVTDIFSEVRMKGPHGMALTNDGNTLFVASEIGEYIFKIDANHFYASDTTYEKAPIDPSVPPSGNGTSNFRPYQIVLSPDQNYLYISCRGANQIRIYNAADLQQVNAINLGTGAFPLLMKFTDNGQYLFVCNRNNNTVSVINTSTQSIVTTITDVGIQPHGVDFSQDGQYAIIACETQSGFNGHHPQVGSQKIGVTRLIKMSNFELTDKRIEMGSFPAGIISIH